MTDTQQLKPLWQSIETAPKNGTHILLYYKNECNKERRIIGKYVAKFTEESTEEFAEYSEEKDEYYTPEGWYEVIDNWDDYSHVAVHCAPVKWMPIPSIDAIAPPTFTQEDVEKVARVIHNNYETIEWAEADEEGYKKAARRIARAALGAAGRINEKN